MPDLQRVIASVAKTYCDSTTPHLQFDNLVGEGNVKLAELITNDKLARLGNRHDFFRYFKTVINNHTRSLVQKYRFTEKRTGQKPPPREQRFNAAPAPKTEDGEDGEDVQEYHKNVEISLDDPDSGIQVPDQHHVEDVDEQEIDWGFSDMAADYAQVLTPVERLVFHEMVMPSARARCFAEQDAMRRAPSGKLSVKVKFAHMAEAVGVSLEYFEEAVLSIRNKINQYRMQSEQQREQTARYNALIAQLKEVFGLHIPPDIDPLVVRRMLTIAARHQFDKLNPQINEMLDEVGAKVPRAIGGNRIACYGVLYQRNCRQCTTCDMRTGCATEAANFGLTKMVLSNKLLGDRQVRVPAFLPHTSSAEENALSPDDENTIIAHLNETFKKADRNGQEYYIHYVGDNNQRRYLLCVDRRTPLRLRFCTPSKELKKRLVGKQKTWHAPEKATLAEIIALIDEHARDSLS